VGREGPIAQIGSAWPRRWDCCFISPTNGCEIWWSVKMPAGRWTALGRSQAN